MSKTKTRTGSIFSGELVDGKMSGTGRFEYPNGTVYDGGFADNNFSGDGKFVFPQRVTGYSTFGARFTESCAGSEGREGTYKYRDGLTYEHKDWEYCQVSDRRFYTEILQGLKPGGRTNRVNKEPAKDIPRGWFDCGDGVYNPATHVVYKYDARSFLRNADSEEHTWILEHCRRGSDFYVGIATKGKDVIPIA